MLSAAGVTTLIHRSVYDVSRAGPATVSEFALGLATFVLGCLGVLLVIHGKALVGRQDPPTGPAARRPAAGAGRARDQGADIVRPRR